MRKPLLLALILLGLWDSAYLAWVYTSPSRPLICLGTGCDVVRASSYAHLWGLPLPMYGVAMYSTLALLIFAEPLIAAAFVPGVQYALVAVSGAGFLASVVLTGIEAFVLHAWCIWCVVSALAVTLIFVLALRGARKPAPQRKPEAAISVLGTYFLVSLIAVGGGTPAFLLLARHGEIPQVAPIPPVLLAERLVRPDSHAAGNPQAAVTVVEFGDFQCPVCGRVQPVVREVRQKYGNRIRFVFRQFPLEALHMYAKTAAEASECAAEQGKFWEAVDKLYDGQSDLSEPAIDRYAAELGLSQAGFRQCLSSGSTAARIQRDVDDAHALGLHGTPTFFIGRQIVQGPIDFDQFSKLLNQELAARGEVVARAQASQGTPNSANPTPDPNGAPAPLLAANPFAQFQSSALACSEEEAKKRQPTTIRTPEAREYFESGPKALFVDVRTAEDFTRGRIRGALNIPVDEIEKRWSLLPKDKIIIFYESGRSPGDVCASSRSAGRVLFAHGFPPGRVKVYQDGLAAWEKAGLPIQR